MNVRAEVAAISMPIESVLALKEGDLLRLNAPATGGITLYADKVPVHTGRPGRVRQPSRGAGHGPRGWAGMSASEALNRLGQSTAEACHGVLEMFAAGKVSIGEVTTLEDSEHGLCRRARPVGRDVGLLRRRRHRRQRLPDHARRRAACSPPR